MDINFANFNKSLGEMLKFDVNNSNSSFVNCLRRIIISNIETVGFRTEDYEESDIKIIENTSSLHNEFLLHRIGLIPINIPDVSTYDPTKYKFSLNVDNKTQNIIDITTNDIEVLNLETNTLEKTEDFFPRNKITNDHILIIRLKPTPDGTGEKIKLEGKSSKGIGKQHIRFSPVSNVCFINKIDPNREAEEFDKYLAQHPESNITELKKKFKLEESERCFHINENGDPHMFEFTIESCGVIEPHKILVQGLNKIIAMINKFTSEFEKSLSNNESNVEIKETKALMKAFDITINNENHTLGHLLQSHINQLFKSENIFVGYKNPHPLEDKIIFRIKVDTINELKKIFTETCGELTKQCEKLLNIISTEFKSDVKPKKKFKVKSAK